LSDPPTRRPRKEEHVRDELRLRAILALCCLGLCMTPTSMLTDLLALFSPLCNPLTSMLPRPSMLHVVSGEQWPPPTPLWLCVLSRLQPRRTSCRCGYVDHRSGLLGHLSVYANCRSDLCFPRCFLSCCHQVPNCRRQKLPP
jgi:hypothetical protein